MLTVSAVAWTFIALGFVAAVLVGYRVYRQAGWAQPLFLVLASLAIGLASSVAAGAAHNVCQKTLGMCYATSDASALSLTMPLVLSPLYWLAACLARWYHRHVELL